MKDLGSTSKIKKLKPGYNIIEEDGVKNIVLYDGKGDPSTIQVFSIEQLWNEEPCRWLEALTKVVTPYYPRKC